MNKRSRGFTLIELLVVIMIILLLCALLGMFIKGLIDRARNTKTHGLIQVLNMGCETYKLDTPHVFPQNGPYVGSQNLHVSLGSQRVVVMQNTSSGPAIKETKPAVMEFKRDQLLGEPANCSPSPGNVYFVMDGWGKEVKYVNNLPTPGPGAKNPKSVDIWSLGKDSADPADDIGNWIRDF